MSKKTKKTTKKTTHKPKLVADLVEVKEATKPLLRQNEAVARAEQCNAEIGKVLERFSCAIQPYIVPTLEPVGQMGDCAQISASYGIRALPRGN